MVKATDNFTIISTAVEGVAIEISHALNRSGQWDTVIVKREKRWDVVLPGDSSIDTQNYMRGFLDGWLTASTLALRKAWIE